MANDLNNLSIIGRLTRDMECKYTNGGMAIGVFSIAVNKKVKKGDAWADYASFFDCKCFGKTAENLAQYMTKGKQVSVQGEITQERWEKDGKPSSKIVITCDKVQLLGGNDSGKPKGNSPESHSSSEPSINNYDDICQPNENGAPATF